MKGNTGSTPEIFKGAKLFIEIGENSFEYFHQGTTTTHDGLTVLRGQGIRWVMNRRKRTKSLKGLSFKDLCTQVCKAHGFALDYKADFDPLYNHVAQVGQTDYDLLKREAENAGLFLSEGKTADGKICLTVKTLRDIQDTTIVLSPGNNLISWTIADEALDGSKLDQSSSQLQNEPKAAIEPLTGTIVGKKPDIDPAKSNDVTGVKADVPKASMAPGQDLKATQAKSRTKRVKGLPSTFLVPLSQETLDLQPLQAVRTKGLPGVLSRVWVVDSVTHDLMNRTTSLGCYSPVEVIDLSPPTPVGGATGGPAGTAAAGTTLNPGGYIYPCRGFEVSDTRRARSATRFHHGTDVSCPTGTPLVASKEGVADIPGFDSGGYGLYICIKHPDGWETRYAHCSELKVQQGASVAQGQLIALSGDTGLGTGPHLHWEFRDAALVSHPPEDVGLSAKLGEVW